VAGLAEVRARSPITIMTVESCFTARDALPIIRQGVADILHIKLMKCGGLYPGLQIVAIAEAAGAAWWAACWRPAWPSPLGPTWCRTAGTTW
jgi:L-alanine-DL-glutamate epimerase-like enolase superfamily enzyme